MLWTKNKNLSISLRRRRGGGDVRDPPRNVGRGQGGSQRLAAARSFSTLVLLYLAVCHVKRAIEGFHLASLILSARPDDAERIIIAGERVPRVPECGGLGHPPSPPFDEPAVSTEEDWIPLPGSLWKENYVNFTSIFSAAANMSAVPVPVNVKVSGFVNGRGKRFDFRNRVASRSGVQKALRIRSRNGNGSGPGGIIDPIAIDRIYYINLEKNHKRRCIMESWLSRQPIPYERVPALRGQNDTCKPDRNGPNCVGLSGVIMTNLGVMKNYNTTGTTLVLEDDFAVRDMLKLRMSVDLVPQDWDVIRFDCWQRPSPHFKRTSPFSYSVVSAKEKGHYCGGAHATLWRNDDGGVSLKRLNDVLSRRPFESGPDCQLTHPSLRSYCINVGVGELLQPKAERSDILKVKSLKK